jgi:hypothetical protein
VNLLDCGDPRNDQRANQPAGRWIVAQTQPASGIPSCCEEAPWVTSHRGSLDTCIRHLTWTQLLDMHAYLNARFGRLGAFTEEAAPMYVCRGPTSVVLDHK